MHRAVLEIVFQVRPSSKYIPDFAPAAALCWIVRFAASLSGRRVLKPSSRDTHSQRAFWLTALRVAARAKLAPKQPSRPALRYCAGPAKGYTNEERCLLLSHAAELPGTRSRLYQTLRTSTASIPTRCAQQTYPYASARSNV